MKTIQVAIAAIGLALLPCTAFAKLSCPEGTDAYINAETYELVCVPKGSNLVDLAAERKNAANTEERQDSASNTECVQIEVQKTETVQNDKSTQEVVQNAAPAPVVQTEDNSKNERYAAIAKQMEVLQWKARGAEGARRSGFAMSIGVGYAFLEAINLNINIGYDFVDHPLLGFGLYFDSNINLGIPLSMEFSAEPAFIVKAGYFRFIIGVGIGYYYQPGTGNSFDDDRLERKDEVNSFMLKPSLKFDWFLSQNTWLGMGFDIPALTKFSIKFDLYFRAGYKF